MTEAQTTFCIARYPDLCAACSAEEQARKKYEHIDDVIKRLMTDLGMPESKSLYLAFKQLQNEIAQLPAKLPPQAQEEQA